MTKFIVCVWMLAIVGYSYAMQPTVPGSDGTKPPSTTVKGIVKDTNTGLPVEFATIGVFHLKDSTLISGTTADEKGAFEINIQPGKFMLTVQFISYKETNFIVEIVRGQTNDLGEIMLTPSIQQLDEVTVTGEKTQMEMTLDKKVYNIGKDLSNLGGSATDILDNLPSVQVDVEGNVSLRGSENVRILINGKPSGLVGLSSNDALRQINANLIERVEIITNPSARYDAEGEAGIINIILKKERRAGINGSFMFNTGWPHNHGASISLNYRKNWVNMFTNLGVAYRKNPGSGNAYQEFGDPITKVTNRTRRNIRGGLNYNITFGFDFNLSKSSTLTTSILYRFSDEKNPSTVKYFDSYTANVPDSLTVRDGTEIEGDNNLQYAINFIHDFKKKDQKLTMDFQYQDNRETESMNLTESSGAINEVSVPRLFQRSGNQEKERQLMAQTDYHHPFAEKGKLELGARYTDRLVGNDYLVEEQNADGIFQTDNNLSNIFEYNERVIAAYAILSNEIAKFSWQLGTRYEQTSLMTELKTTNVKNNQLYNSFFPSVFLTYKLTKIHSLQTSYSRRIRRPRGWFLNPFYSISDSRNYFTGNPNLQPVFTDSYELGLLINSKKSSYYGGLYHRRSTGVMQRLRVTIDGITYIQPYNISERNDTGLEFNINSEFTPWYRINANLNIFHSFTDGGTIVFKEQTTTFNKTEIFTVGGRISNNFKFKNILNGQINIIYRAPSKTPQGKRYSITALDIGLSRDIFKGKGSIAFNVRDVFNSRKYRGESYNTGYYEKSDFQWRSRTAQLTLTYRLNQKQQQRRRNNRDDGQFDEGAEGF